MIRKNNSIFSLFFKSKLRVEGQNVSKLDIVLKMTLIHQLVQKSNIFHTANGSSSDRMNLRLLLFWTFLNVDIISILSSTYGTKKFLKIKLKWCFIAFKNIFLSWCNAILVSKGQMWWWFSIWHHMNHKKDITVHENKIWKRKRNYIFFLWKWFTKPCTIIKYKIYI